MRVLVVEDEVAIRDLLGLIITRAGYEVLKAANGRRALQLLIAPNQVALILLDMRMPGMDGWEFVRELPSIKREQIPVVVITAAADAQAWAQEVGAVTYLAKPFTPEDVRNVIHMLMPSEGT